MVGCAPYATGSVFPSSTYVHFCMSYYPMVHRPDRSPSTLHTGADFRYAFRPVGTNRITTYLCKQNAFGCIFLKIQLFFSKKIHRFYAEPCTSMISSLIPLCSPMSSRLVVLACFDDSHPAEPLSHLPCAHNANTPPPRASPPVTTVSAGCHHGGNGAMASLLLIQVERFSHQVLGSPSHLKITCILFDACPSDRRYRQLWA